ncbi:hypothetical protein CPB86DRAFT_783704 [Serendipita vermifera]|nr:hypothetical protein CPB86DRAFT_783704 [Serendipita vermifera]
MPSIRWSFHVDAYYFTDKPMITTGWTEACHVSAPNRYQQSCGRHWDGNGDYVTLFRVEHQCP